MSVMIRLRSGDALGDYEQTPNNHGSSLWALRLGALCVKNCPPKIEAAFNTENTETQRKPTIIGRDCFAGATDSCP